MNASTRHFCLILFQLTMNTFAIITTENVSFACLTRFQFIVDDVHTFIIILCRNRPVFCNTMVSLFRKLILCNAKAESHISH